MVINQGTDYAFRIVFFLAKHKHRIVEAIEISSREEIPERFLFKIMRSLVKAGIVKSYRGKNGGFTLGREPKDITLNDVLEAIEGPVTVNACLRDASKCTKDASGYCVIHRRLAQLRWDIVEKLKAVDFETLVKDERILLEGLMKGR